jgi:predicted acyl esterase
VMLDAREFLRAACGKYDRSGKAGASYNPKSSCKELKRIEDRRKCMRVGLRTALGWGLMWAMVAAAGAQVTAAPPPTLTPQQRMQQMLTFFKTHYEKHEYRIPMRDGVKLYTQVYTPIASQFEDKGPYPFLMTRTPYSCGSYDDATVMPRVTGNMDMLESGYILVCQDVRGRWESEGSWLEMTPPKDGKGIDESTDMYDTVDWMLKNVAGNNGKVGIQGISYPGFYTAASIINGHPAIKAASPQAPMMNLFDGDDSYHGGAFMLAANHSFYAPFYRPQKNPLKVEPANNFEFFTKDAYAYYLKMGTLANLDSPAGGTNPLYHDQTIHDTYDSYWVARNMENHMFGVKAAVMAVGGWFDAEDLAGPVKLFHAIAKESPEAAAGNGRFAGGHPVRIGYSGVFPQDDRGSVFRALFEGRAVDSAAQGVHV